jgi:ribosomal protein L2
LAISRERFSQRENFSLTTEDIFLNFLWLLVTFAEMGKVIRGQRKGKGSVFKAHNVRKKGPVSYKRADFAERNGYTKGIVTEILHDKGRGAPICRVQFKDAYRFKKVTSTLVAVEGLHTGQFVYAGKKGGNHFSICGKFSFFHF